MTKPVRGALARLWRRWRSSWRATPHPLENGDDWLPPEGISDQDLRKLRLVMQLVNDRSQPNVNDLATVVRNIDILALNVKTMGYDLARALAAALPHDAPTAARHVGLACKPATQEDMESDWVRHWCRELHIPVVLHRKLWELAYLLQALHDAGHLAAGRRGLGFGCGTEPIASYLAAHGIDVTMTDLPPEDMRAAGWSRSSQHAPTPEHARAAHLIDRATFAARVSHRHVDMNAIPDDLAGYDFCWSICALEHLGSIGKGQAFVEAALRTLRPGGTAVHTFEHNVDPDGPTIDNWMTVLFQRRHLEELASRLRAQGHHVAELDFRTGDGPLDRFVDLPPWDDRAMAAPSRDLGPPMHLKVAIDGFVSTCFGMIVTKSQDPAPIYGT